MIGCNEREWPVGGSASKQPVGSQKELPINPSWFSMWTLAPNSIHTSKMGKVKLREQKCDFQGPTWLGRARIRPHIEIVSACLPSFDSYLSGSYWVQMLMWDFPHVFYCSSLGNSHPTSRSATSHCLLAGTYWDKYSPSLNWTPDREGWWKVDSTPHGREYRRLVLAQISPPACYVTGP